MSTETILLGWISTAMILLGSFLNARGKALIALIIWIVGDVCWIIYDLWINNYSHLALSLIIIVINAYGIWNLNKIGRL